MGVSFTYYTREEVSEEARVAIRAEAHALNVRRKWVSTEPIWFFSMDGFESKAIGDSKFIPKGVGAESDGVADVEFIINALAEWSKRFNISWQITAEEVEVGVIEDGQPDSSVLGFVNSLSDAELWQG